MSSLRKLSFGILGFVLYMGASGCSTTLWQVGFVKPAQAELVPANVPFLKCHLHSGEVFVFSRWELHEDRKTISGAGLHYTADRRLVEKGMFELPGHRIALLETDQPESVRVHGEYIVMGTLSVISLVLSVAVLALLLG